MGLGTLELDVRTLGSGTPEVDVQTLGLGTPELDVRTPGSGTLEVDVRTLGLGTPELDIRTPGSGTPSMFEWWVWELQNWMFEPWVRELRNSMFEPGLNLGSRCSMLCFPPAPATPMFEPRVREHCKHPCSFAVLRMHSRKAPRVVVVERSLLPV